MGKEIIHFPTVFSCFANCIKKTTPHSDDDIIINIETLINGVILEKIGVHGCPLFEEYANYQEIRQIRLTFNQNKSVIC